MRTGRNPERRPPSGNSAARSRRTWCAGRSTGLACCSNTVRGCAAGAVSPRRGRHCGTRIRSARPTACSPGPNGPARNCAPPAKAGKRSGPEPGYRCPRRSCRSPGWPREDCRTGKSASGCTSRTGPSARTCTGSSPSWASARGPSWDPRWPAAPSRLAVKCLAGAAAALPPSPAWTQPGGSRRRHRSWRPGSPLSWHGSGCRGRRRAWCAGTSSPGWPAPGSPTWPPGRPRIRPCATASRPSPRRSPGPRSCGCATRAGGRVVSVFFLDFTWVRLDRVTA